jgi:hypothetical protein
LIPGNKSRFLLAAAMTVALLAAASSPALAEEKPFRYGLENNNPVFLTRKASLDGGSFRLAIRDGKSAQIRVELVDIFSDGSGSKKTLPLGTTAFSPKGLVKFKKKFSEYTPSSEFQYFEVPFRFKKKVRVNAPVLGGIKISLVTEDLSTSAVTIESSVVGTFAYLPKGSALNFSPAISLSETQIIRTGRDFPPFGIIPDFPFLYNGGKFVAQYEFENTGDIFLEATSEVVVRGPLFFGWGSEQEPFSFTSPQSFLVPNQIIQSKLPIELTLENGKDIDPLGFGVYELITTVNGSLGSELETTVTKSRVIVIFPWKYALFFLLLTVIFRRRIKSSITRLAQFAKNLKEFSRQQGAQRALLSPNSPIVEPEKSASSQELSVSKEVLPPTRTGKILLDRVNPFPSKKPDPISNVPSDLKPLYPASYDPIQAPSNKDPGMKEAEPGGSSDPSGPGSD